MLEIKIAQTAEELEAIARFRYSVYVEEMGRYQRVADHDHHLLLDPEDEWSWVAYALDGEEVVATTRVTWGGAGFSSRQTEQYGLAPFLAEIPAERMAVGERHMIAPEYRGGDVFLQMQCAFTPLNEEHDVRMVFGACEPHLLSYYLRWQRPCAKRNVNSAEAGYLIPMVAFLPGPEAMVDAGLTPGMPASVQAVLDCECSVRSPLLCDADAYFADVRSMVAAVDAPVFEGFTDDEFRRALASSNVIRCADDDRILKQGGAARNVFVVLSGALEVNDGEHPVAVLLPGDVFGETAYLLQQPRGFNVDALSDDTCILSLSERTLRNLCQDDPAVGTKLLGNISKVLCRRLAKTG